jgi:hypothetical protein
MTGTSLFLVFSLLPCSADFGLANTNNYESVTKNQSPSLSLSLSPIIYLCNMYLFFCVDSVDFFFLLRILANKKQVKGFLSAHWNNSI